MTLGELIRTIPKKDNVCFCRPNNCIAAASQSLPYPGIKHMNSRHQILAANSKYYTILLTTNFNHPLPFWNHSNIT